ncbi:hypothetical protein F511_40654 [Dorcoceras hygrometricum]|uniref:Uncharacterized protein n=1 Tax=Dorcoceras hygrometricum TaxID=472368 RepID=A0A2Z7BZS0_9LAMI|nr:hypothetical protein F511_40654 [Dorcoceras hygrometricum]
MLMELLVRADLGTTTKLQIKKVLTSKQVQNYLKGNQGTTPTEETTRNTAGGTSQQVPPEVTQSLADDTEQDMPNPRKQKHKVSTNDDPEEESETDSCPLVPRQHRATQVSESSASLPLTHLLQRLRTQRPDHTIPPDPIPARTTAPAESLQVGNIDNLMENLDLNDQTEQDENHNHNVHLSHQTIPTEGEGFKDGDEQRDHGSHKQGIGDINLEEGLYQDTQKEHEKNIADNEQFAHGSEEPETIAPTPDAQIHSASASADQYCQSLIASAREKLLEWAETEDITELSERRSLILYKLLETELEQLYLAHLANFKTSVASAHYDFECIHLLHQELRLIAAGHKHHRGLAGLPLISPECDFLPKFSSQSEIYHFTGTARGSVLDAYQHVNQTAAHAPHEHHAQETEPQIQMPDHDTHGHDGQSSEDGVDLKINDIPISVINSEELPSTKQIVSPHPNPDFSTLRMIAITPQVSSTLHLLHNATQSLNVISTHVSSLDQSYARLCDDSLITRHHTTKLRNELKSTAEGFDIKIDVLERTLTQRLIDELAVVKSQLAYLVEYLKGSGAAKKGEGGSSSRPMEGPSIRGSTGGRGGSSSQGGRGRNDDPERFKYSKWF